MEGSKKSLIRSLRLRLCIALALVGIVYSGISAYRTYQKNLSSFNSFVDEDLNQIANVIVGYDVMLPKSWDRPHHGLLKKKFGRLYLEEPMYFEQHFFTVPSLNDLFDRHQEIIVAPLFVQPGQPFYFPLGVKDGYYTVLIQDRRVRALVATNKAGTRFVVARPYALLEDLAKRAYRNSIAEFLFLILIFIPITALLVNIMFIPVNKLANQLEKRKDSDLTPLDNEHLPSEMDAFMSALNKLFTRTQSAIEGERRFIADAAHELRTPLTAISLQAQSIDEAKLNQTELLKLKQLKLAINKQRKLTNDLLAYAKTQIEHQINKTSFKLKDLFIEIIEDLGTLADEKDIDLGVVSEGDYELTTDRDKLKACLINLASNSIKYCDKGSICDLGFNLEKDKLEIFVADNGPGIDKKELKQVFNAFYRIGGDTSKIEGTGLGLSIVKSNCELIDAKISLENQDKGGLKATIIFSV